VAAAVLGIVAATFLFPVRPQIGGLPGLFFWTALTLVGSAMPVRLPKGVVVSVSAAPIMGAIILGGPLAAAIVCAVGTTDSREVRGTVPWYGTLFNHAALVVAAVSAGSVFELIFRLTNGANSRIDDATAFGALLAASGVLYLVNWTLSIAAVSARTDAPMRTIWSQDIGGVAMNLLGLVPLGWLMAQIFQLPNGVGWWATPLFVVPLFTTRLAYHRYVETRDLFEQTIRALSKAVDARDRYTRGHSERVSHIAEAMCRALRLPETEIEVIKWAGLLHDVGKIGVRDNVLLKEGPLDREERILMNKHPIIGAEIVQPASQLSLEAPLIRWHHEWFNGSGYPDGIEALDIPLGARIMGVADSYEAMTSARPYRKTPLTHEQAVAELEKYSGIQFDPKIVPILIGLDREILDRKPERDDDLPSMLDQGPPAQSQPEPPSSPPAQLPQRAASSRAADEQNPTRSVRRKLADDVP